jgi:DNA-binding CsgD family transcriptional regulator
MSKQLKSPATLGPTNVKKSSKVQTENKDLNAFNFQELSSIIDEIMQEDELKKHYKIQKLMMFFNYPVQEFKTVQNLEIKTSKRENKRKKLADFRTKLLFLHPDLTESEIHLIDLIIKERSCTEIGEILDLTPGTVRVYKNKLKIKLGLSADDNLFEYLKTCTNTKN